MTKLITITAVLFALASSARADDTDTEPEVHKPAKRRWSIALGPSLWAASIDTTINLGPLQIHRHMAFAQIAQYYDGGISGSIEARFDRFTASGNFSTGTLAADTATDTVEAAGTLTTKLAEVALGYEVLGDADARWTLALRGGLRYTQTDIDAMGTFDIAGTSITAGGGLHRGGTDYLAGARGRFRASKRVDLIATGDTRIGGDSYASWSLSGDVSVRALRWLTVQAGWRVLETQANPTVMRRNGPQLLVMVNI